jgi:hypothetical protein
MDLPLTADWLVPLGAGVVVLAALIVLVLWLRRGRRRQGEPVADGSPAPQPEPERPVFPPEPAGPPTTSFAAVPAHWSGGSRPAGAAGVSSERPADTGAPAVEQARPSQAPEIVPEMAPAPQGPPSGPVPVAPWARVGGEEGVTDLPYGVPETDGVHAGRDHTASSRTVAAAVAQAFAVRAAAGRPSAPEQPPPARVQPPPVQPPPAPPPPQQGGSQQLPAGRDDARDRLLAVLLHDPALAVDATIQLDACRAQLDRLSRAVHHERGVLREILQRLAGTGLRTDQLARLAGMPVEELQALLAPVSSR